MYAALALGVFSRSQQQLLGHDKVRHATMARWPPDNGMCVMSILAGRVRRPRVTVLSVVNGDGSGVRQAAVGAAAGALASRCWQSGTPWKLERAPAWGPPAVVNCLMASAVRDQSAPPFPLGGNGQLTLVGLIGAAAPRAREEAREAVRVR